MKVCSPFYLIGGRGRVALVEGGGALGGKGRGGSMFLEVGRGREAAAARHLVRCNSTRIFQLKSK